MLNTCHTISLGSISHPAVSTAIPGTKDPQQALANAAAGMGLLSDDEMERVRLTIDNETGA